MRTYRQRLNQFTRTTYVMDHRTDAMTQRIAEIRRKAQAYEVKHKTASLAYRKQQRYNTIAKRAQRNKIKWYAQQYASLGMHDVARTLRAAPTTQYMTRLINQHGASNNV